MKSAWRASLIGAAGVALLIGDSAASQAHRVGLALLLCAAGAFLLAIDLWSAGRPR